MNSKLELVKSEKFGNVNCDFWKDNKNIWMTREQIGSALEYYPDPSNSVAKIHQRHSNRLNQYSVVVKLSTTTGSIKETYLYNAKGVYEICRWSRQPKADAFMDWVWNIIDSLRTGELQIAKQGISLTPEAIKSIVESIIGQKFNVLQNDIDKRMNGMENAFTYIRKILDQSNIALNPIDNNWKINMFKRVDELVKQLPIKYKDSKDVLRHIYNKMNSVYGIVWDQEQKEYKQSCNLISKAKTMDMIASKKMYKSVFESILNGMFDTTESEQVKEAKEVKSILDDIRDSIEMLAKKNNDISLHYNKTYHLVYNKMGVSWSNRQSRYINSHNVKNKPNKITLIKNNPMLYKKFKNAVNELFSA